MAANTAEKATNLAKSEPKSIARYELPKRVEPSVPERSLPLENLVNGTEIVILGTRGDVFNPGKGPCIRMVWQYAEAVITEDGEECAGYPVHGPDRSEAWESLVSVGSLPARLALEIEETGDVRLCQIQVKTSVQNPGQSYYILV